MNDSNDLRVAKKSTDTTSTRAALLVTFEPHPRTDFLRSLEASVQTKLFRVARQDDERICTRPDLIIRICDAADFVC